MFFFCCTRTSQQFAIFSAFLSLEIQNQLSHLRSNRFPLWTTFSLFLYFNRSFSLWFYGHTMFHQSRVSWAVCNFQFCSLFFSCTEKKALRNSSLYSSGTRAHAKAVLISTRTRSQLSSAQEVFFLHKQQFFLHLFRCCFSLLLFTHHLQMYSIYLLQ